MATGAAQLSTIAEHDGDIFGEDWSLDAGIADKQLHLRVIARKRHARREQAHGGEPHARE